MKTPGTSVMAAAMPAAASRPGQGDSTPGRVRLDHSPDLEEACQMDRQWWGILVILMLVLGCRAKQPASAEQLAGRLNAAAAISNVAQRNDALAAVAEDAADAGETGVVKRAIDQISNVSLKNDVAYSCALKLSERGKSQEATDVAKLITDIAKQNEALRKIAQGSS